jgi:hypothetical protein
MTISNPLLSSSLYVSPGTVLLFHHARFDCGGISSRQIIRAEFSVAAGSNPPPIHHNVRIDGLVMDITALLAEA